jgi:hypothetical protein
MDTNKLRSLQEAYLEVVEGQQLDEADSLAAMQARREKRLAAQRKREGTTATGRDFGHDYSLTPAQQKARREAEFKAGTKKEEVSVYDIILSHLLDEGYAETPEAAKSIMVNMSEEWRDSIFEADSLAAMAARREKRLARQRKQMGTSSTGQDFGHDYSISSAERKKRQQAEFDKFVGKKTKK